MITNFVPEARPGCARRSLLAPRRRAAAVKAGILGDRVEVLGALALVIADTDRLRSAGLAPIEAGGRA